MCHQSIRRGQREGSNRSLSFLCELSFSPYSIIVANFVLIPLNNVIQGRKLELIIRDENKKFRYLYFIHLILDIYIIKFNDNYYLSNKITI